MTEDMVFPLTFSGVRPGEEAAVKALMTGAGLTIEDVTPLKLAHFIVARMGDEIVGTVGLEPCGREALLRSLVVAEGYRGQAVATRLVSAMEKYARSHGAEVLYLLTMDAAGFFTKQGYRLADRRVAPAGIQSTAEFRALCPASAQCLCKRLAS